MNNPGEWYWTCDDCGALIGDAPTHERWHAKLVQPVVVPTAEREEPKAPPAEEPKAPRASRPRRSPWLSQQEAGDYLGVTDRTIRNYVKRGLLKGYRVPGSTLIRIKRTELERLARVGADEGADDPDVHTNGHSEA